MKNQKRALEAELADCKSDLAATEKQGDAAHNACVGYEARTRTLEVRNAALREALSAAQHWLFDDGGSRICDEDTAQLVNDALATGELK